MRSAGPGACVAGGDGCIYRPCPCRLPPVRHSSYWMQLNLHTCVYMCVYAYNSTAFCLIKQRNCHQNQAGHITNPRNLDLLRTEAKRLPSGLHHRRCGCWELSFSTALRAGCGGGAVTVAAFVFNFGFYCLWWCIYYHCFLYFWQYDFRFMYKCIFTYKCVFCYVLGQRWPNKQVKSNQLF